MVVTIKLIKSPNKKKKFRMLFLMNGKVFHDEDFGARGYSDYTKHKDKERKERYLARHEKNEDWGNPFTAGALSRWILWNKPSLQASFNDYKRKFNFK